MRSELNYGWYVDPTYLSYSACVRERVQHPQRSIGRTCYDVMGLMQQLGLIPSQG